MKNTLLLLVFSVSCWHFSCTPSNTVGTQSKTLPDYFQPIPSQEVIRFEVTQGDTVIQGDTISNSLFFSQLETRLMNDVPYLDNSGELTVIGRVRFPLTENVDAYLVDIRQNWYQHQSLFMFDKQKSAFTARQTVAEFYGGEGGQILTGSWLTDYDKDGNKDLVRREIEHWIILEEENTRDTMAEHGKLLLWKNGQFVETAADSAALVKKYPIRSMW